MRADLVIRPYDVADRAAVRTICHRTGYMGQSAAWYWRDLESFATLFTGYYTDHEPASALVCEMHGDVVGYLLGCENTSQATDPAAVFGQEVIRRGLLFRPGTAGFVWRSMAEAAVAAVRHRLPPSTVVDRRWPAHVHVDLLPGARGRGVGASMMRRWLETLRSKAVAGCHVQTLTENSTAVAFFEAMGFVLQGAPVPVPGLRAPDGARHHVQLMALQF